ncbi:hypothetical protein ART_1274 [Arthrobacter sp. PAMC 25486]|uniref:alkaline ceramidase n=1 Tax=Arthrobacter sp. PAMC 25486 TaxID=1494608 RepID=UPI000536101D|nr:alkaline ceramidase [Arthrobacter sp. PAMC 25486]AIY00873.1 hypothetical protein ART_1274 [Arthrobacter sp. PAMC 25486]
MKTVNDAHWILVGASVEEVSVPSGTPMAGYAARVGPSSGVHDPLTVRAIVIEGVCWITMDVCGLDEKTCSDIREAVPLPADHVVVSATHTHSGPCSMPDRLGNADSRFLAALCRAALKAFAAALSDRTLCTVSYESFRGLRIAQNRRHPQDDIDPELQVVVFTSRSGSVVAWLMQFPCHPVVLGADNHLISGDYPAYTRIALEQAEPGSIALFLTGAAGDVNTGHTAESSYTQNSSPTRTFHEAERIGRTLAATGMAARESPRLARSGLRVLTAEVHLELEVLDVKTPVELAGQWEQQTHNQPPGERALLRIWSDWAHAQNTSAEMTWTGTITVMALAGILLVALPGEPFLAGAEKIKGAFEIPVIVAGYSNGCPGYFPTDTEYEFGGYEVMDAHRYYGMPAPFKRGSLEILVESAIRIGQLVL